MRDDRDITAVHLHHRQKAISTTAIRGVGALLVLVLSAGCLSSCVELKVEPDVATLQADTPPKSDSLTYNLSESTITVTGTVTLNDCDSVVAGALLKPADPPKNRGAAPLPPPPALPVDAPPVDITENFTVSVSTQADPRYQYQIPFKDLEGWTKQLNLTVARNPNKTLVSINGTITDQAGPTILAAAQAAGFTAATGAANAQATAVAARNTAVAGQNTAGAAQTTAATAAATFADTVNKALADCLTQQAAIVKAGGRPVACQ